MALRRVLFWVNTTTPPAWLASELTPKSRCHKGQLSPTGSLAPHPPAQPLTPAGLGTLPHRGQQRGGAGDPSRPGGSTRTGVTGIDPHFVVRLRCQQQLPQPLSLPAAAQAPGISSRNTAGKSVSIHSPEAPPASPRPAKRMRTHAQIIFNLYFYIACKCTAER